MEFYRSSTGGHTPIWGEPTSTLNFCEVDYEHTPYIAELFNTLTNITYIGLGIKGLLNNRRLGENGLGQKLPYVALINLGIASSLFHSTLKYGLQMCDEFSMLIATFIVFHRIYSISQTRVSPEILFVGLCLLMAAVVISQLSMGTSTVQQIVFTGTAYWLFRKCFQLIRESEGDENLKKRMKWTAVSGIAFFISGHMFWTLDFLACDSLRATRKSVGMPWAALLEFHGFWHIFTGIGVYIFMVLVECVRLALGSKGSSQAGPRVSSAGTWPFMVYLESSPVRDVKKDN